MTRAFQVLMNFARVCANGDTPAVTDEVRVAARAAVDQAVQLRSENAIVYIGTDEDGSQKYFGSKGAVASWAKREPGRHYRTEDLSY